MKRTTWGAMLITFLLLSLVAGCAAKRTASPTKDQYAGPAQPGLVLPGASGSSAAPAPPKSGDAQSTTIMQEAAGERMIVQNVTMAVIVEDTDRAVAELQALVTSRKGFISDSRRWYDSDQPYARMTLRVPADSLPEVLSQIRAMVIKVDNENLSGQDVTDQYTDNAARLRNLEATEKELLALLTEVRENRGKAEDILAVYRELTDIRGQIETLKGRQQYLERMTAMATIQIDIRPKQAPKPLVEKETWDPLITANRALRAFVSLVRVLVDLAIYLLVFGWPVVVLGIIIWALARRSRRRKASRPADTTPQRQ